MELTSKVVLITGGSAGIGLALARRMVGAGAKVALLARTVSTLEAAVAELGADAAAAFPLDVCDRAAVDQVPAAVLARFGRLDILVNNAGLNHRGPVMGRSAEQLAEVIQVNLTAPIYLTRRVLEVLPPGGAIINISSLAGKVPFGDQAAYCASKAGLRAYSMALREELAARDIQVSCVNPGPVDTDFFGDLRNASNMTFSQPMSSPEAVAQAILDCLAQNRAELDIPYLSGKLTTLGYLSPSLKRFLRPLMERHGAAKKEAYLRKRESRQKGS